MWVRAALTRVLHRQRLYEMSWMYEISSWYLTHLQVSVLQMFRHFQFHYQFLNPDLFQCEINKIKSFSLLWKLWCVDISTSSCVLTSNAWAWVSSSLTTSPMDQCSIRTSIWISFFNYLENDRIPVFLITSKTLRPLVRWVLFLIKRSNLSLNIYN